jgi:hypothetical protein
MATLGYGHLDCEPVVYVKQSDGHISEGWVLFKGAWRPIHWSEFIFNVGLLTPEAFDRSFGDVPPLPPETDGLDVDRW